MLEKRGFQPLLEKGATMERRTRAMPVHRFVLAPGVAWYVGQSRLESLSKGICLE
jgi:hypothetical protein